MVTSGSVNIESTINDIASKAFTEFCSGMDLMFEIEIECEKKDSGTQTIEALEEHFNKLMAAYAVQAKGSINGTFYFLLDQPGVFTLPGTIVMHPKGRIQTNCKKGTIEDVNPILDSIKELGNLLVGVWDKVAREEFDDNTHLLQTNTHAGTLEDIPEEFFEISDDEEFTYLSFEITVESFSPFVCGVILPKSLFSEESE